MSPHSRVKVHVRLKPPTVGDLTGAVRGVHNMVEVDSSSASGDIRRRGSQQFNHVHHWDSTQGDVWETFKPDLDKVLQGESVLVLAYGQTGSGKTFTMLGPGLMHAGTEWDSEEMWQQWIVGNPDDRGLVVRASELIFSAELRDRKVRMKFEQIFDEKVYDLFGAPTGDPPSRIPSHVKPVREGSWQNVTSIEEAFGLLVRGCRNRVVLATEHNQFSSRSHSIVTFRIAKRGSSFSEAGSLRLVDLAGSERCSTLTAKHVDNVSINKSLLVLGRVITALAKPLHSTLAAKVADPYLPLRDSKLTYLLKDALQKGLIVLCCCLSSSNSHLSQTLSTLRFASSAAAIVRTTSQGVQKQDKHASIELELAEMRIEKEKMERENKYLKEQLAMIASYLTNQARVPRSSLEKALSSDDCEASGQRSPCPNRWTQDAQLWCSDGHDLSSQPKPAGRDASSILRMTSTSGFQGKSVGFNRTPHEGEEAEGPTRSQSSCATPKLFPREKAHEDTQLRYHSTKGCDYFYIGSSDECPSSENEIECKKTRPLRPLSYREFKANKRGVDSLSP